MRQRRERERKRSKWRGMGRRMKAELVEVECDAVGADVLGVAVAVAGVVDLAAVVAGVRLVEPLIAMNDKVGGLERGLEASDGIGSGQTVERVKWTSKHQSIWRSKRENERERTLEQTNERIREGGVERGREERESEIVKGKEERSSQFYFRSIFHAAKLKKTCCVLTSVKRLELSEFRRSGLSFARLSRTPARGLSSSRILDPFARKSAETSLSDKQQNTIFY